MLNGAFLDAGDAKTKMILSVVSVALFKIPFAYVFSNTSLGAKGLWLLLSVSFLATAIVSFIVFKRDKWLYK